MGLGVLDVKHAEPVPGTVLVFDDLSRPVPPDEIDSRLKYDRSGATPIILVPQPSDDPNDPLNWPLWQRDCQLVILCLISIVASTLSPLLAANTLTLALYFRKTFTDMALLTGYHLCGVAVGGIFFVPMARMFGKRHLYLLGTCLIIGSSAWGGATGRDYTSLLWARVVQGVGLAPFEALVNASVGDMYCVHQRGTRMALTNMSLFGGAFFTPILVGKITHTLGWQWSFYFIAIFASALLPFIFFFLPETAYRRPDHLNTDITGGKSIHSQHPSANFEMANRDRQLNSSNKNSGDSDNPIFSQKGVVPAKVSFARSLLPFNGFKVDEGFFRLVVRPFPLFLHPAVVWGCLIQGTLIGWTVMIGVVLAAIFLGPPLFFDEVKTGYMYTGAFIGAFLGFIFAGLLADWSTKLLIRRNNGVYEPEFRIVLVAAQLVVGCVGLYGFGITSTDVGRYGWALPDFFFGLEVMGMVIGAVASALYIVDAYREIAVEAFTCMLIFKNLFSFGLTWSAYQWLLQAGILKVFLIIASVQVGVCLLSIPMYVFGKRHRSFMHRHDPLRWTRSEG